jgi:broad specificity phosphatase PhoE
MKVFLIRHGETALNAAGVLRGQLDVALNATGEQEARALGAHFAGVPLGAVVSSPLVRALDTARQVATSSGAPLLVDERLRDRFYGELAGYSIEQVEERFGSVDAAPGVESYQALAVRAEMAFFDAAARAQAEGPVALVTHDAVVRALLGLLVPVVGSAKLELPTGSWSELIAGSVTGPWTVGRVGELPACDARP